MELLAFTIPLDLAINLGVVSFTLFIILLFYRKGVVSFREVKKQIQHESEFYTEIVLGLESAGQNICNPGLLDKNTRIAVWELYNNLRVQTTKENKSITLHRKMLEKKQGIYLLLEKGRVEVEILPFLGVIGTLLGFAVSFITNKLSFNVTGVGFFLAASSTVFALLCVIRLKKKYEAVTIATFDYFIEQQNSVEKIMVTYEGFKLLEDWLKRWPKSFENPEKNLAETQEVSMANFID